MIRLFPKEETFLPQFQKLAALVVEAAKALDSLVGDFRDVEVKVSRIKHLEHEADQVTHGTLNMLGRTWITPIDREDIHTLVQTLDDVIDEIDAAAARFVLYKIGKTTPELKSAAEQIVQSAEAIERAIGLLSDMKHSAAIMDACVEIKRLESEADSLHRIAVSKLFENEKDPIQVLKWKELYEFVETATDRCEDVANVLEQIVLKAS